MRVDIALASRMPGPIDGWVEIWDLPLKGKPYKMGDSDFNVITDGGRQRWLEMGAGLSTNSIRHVAIGDSGINAGPPRLLDVPVIAVRSNVALANEVGRKPADSIALSASIANELIYTVEFLTGDGPYPFFNISEPVVNEVGLFADGDNLLAARRTFPSIPFDVFSRLGLRFVWHILMV